MRVLSNEFLTFPLSNIATTGELLNRAQVAYYKELAFVVKGENVGLRGSLHKHWDGGSNYADFDVNDIRNIIVQIAEKFDFDINFAKINFIEIGVNIRMDYSPTKLIKSLVRFRNKPFESLPTKGRGYGRKCEMQQFVVKFYDKSMQNQLPYHLLRFEIKVKRIEFLKNYGLTGLTLADLTRPDCYPAFQRLLSDVFSGTVMFDPDFDLERIINPKDRKLAELGRYPEYWERLERSNRCRSLKRFQELAGSDKIKSHLLKLITEKCNKLTGCRRVLPYEEMQQINRLNLRPKNEGLQRNNPTINCYNVASCSVTGLKIINQKKGCKYLSAIGAQWYFENDAGIFQNKLLSLLSEQWIKNHRDNNMREYYDEIYHQIRNRANNPKNNPRNNLRKSIFNLERKGLKLFPILETIDPEKLKLIS